MELTLDSYKARALIKGNIYSGTKVNTSESPLPTPPQCDMSTSPRKSESSENNAKYAEKSPQVLESVVAVDHDVDAQNLVEMGEWRTNLTVAILKTGAQAINRNSDGTSVSGLSSVLGSA